MTNIYPSKRRTLVDQRKHAVDEQTASSVQAGKFILPRVLLLKDVQGTDCDRALPLH